MLFVTSSDALAPSCFLLLVRPNSSNRITSAVLTSSDHQIFFAGAPEAAARPLSFNALCFRHLHFCDLNFKKPHGLMALSRISFLQVSDKTSDIRHVTPSIAWSGVTIMIAWFLHSNPLILIHFRKSFLKYLRLDPDHTLATAQRSRSNFWSSLNKKKGWHRRIAIAQIHRQIPRLWNA